MAGHYERVLKTKEVEKLTLQSKVKQLQMNLDESNNNLVHLTEKLLGVNNRMEAMEKEFHSQKESYERSTKQFYENKILELNTGHDNKIKQLQTEIDCKTEMNRKWVTETRNIKDSLEKLISELKVEINKLKKENKKLKEKLLECNKKIEQYKTFMDLISRDVNKISSIAKEYGDGFPARAPLPNGITLIRLKISPSRSLSFFKFQAWLMEKREFVRLSLAVCISSSSCNTSNTPSFHSLLTISNPSHMASTSSTVNNLILCKALAYALLPSISSSYIRLSTSIDRFSFSKQGLVASLRSIITDITVNRIKDTLPRDKLRSRLNFVNQVSEFRVPLDTSFLMLISKLSASTSSISRISSLLNIRRRGSLATFVK
ncbi:hypothetical protein NQ315_007720 [Exocentrus adspersus]|uniref:Uncharacterized protein n=1 Tax=Exocentrus adspersus TaxID=1586481 RepID=A0AAV8W7U2_9CUCU|nr:hypothetical protein NQ315_007720 [Exocentrus adspersus]